MKKEQDAWEPEGEKERGGGDLITLSWNVVFYVNRLLVFNFAFILFFLLASCFC